MEDETLNSFIEYGQQQALSFLPGEGEEVNLPNASNSNLPEVAQNTISQFQQFAETGLNQVVSNLSGEGGEVNLPNLPNLLPQNAQQAISTSEQLIQAGQQQVRSNLNAQGSDQNQAPNQNQAGNQNQAQNQINSFGAGNNSENDSITGSGQGNSSNPGFAAEFVPAGEGSENIGLVNFQIGEETIGGFTLGFGGPIPANQQGGSGGFGQQGGFGGPPAFLFEDTSGQ